MTTRRLVAQSIRHYWRTHLGVILGSALAALVLTGALMVGDSVKATLRAQAEARLAGYDYAMTTGDRFIHSSAAMFSWVSFESAALLVHGSASREDGSARINSVQVLGVDRSMNFSAKSQFDLSVPKDELAVNSHLAERLGIKIGDSLLVRVEKVSAISKEAPLSGSEEEFATIRAKVSRILSDEDGGRFALSPSSIPPATVFVNWEQLSEKLGVPRRANLLLSSRFSTEASWQMGLQVGFFPQITYLPVRRFLDKVFPPTQRPRSSEEYEEIGRTVSSSWNRTVFLRPGLGGPDDPAGQLRELGRPVNGVELRTQRIFLDPPVVAATPATIEGTALRPLESLTYFVNELRAGDGSDAKANATPYSMVTAIDAAASGFVNPKLADDEIQITRWLADDLGAKAGDKITLRYFVMGERRMLEEKARTFTVREPILEMSEPELNTSWMPDFPNVPDKDSFGKWKPGFDFDAKRIRKQDEDYWKQYRGTPKAFVTLKTGQEMWGNRWGNLTSIRWMGSDAWHAKAGIGSSILQKLKPASLGFRFIPLRAEALAATNAPVDFGELFVYFSFFLIAAAAVLTGLLFTFTIEQRAAEAGLLLATGWPVKKVRRLFLREGFVLALIGSLAGALLAALYTKGVLHALAGVWGGATGGTRFVFAPSAVTMAIGVVSGVFVALVAMWLASRRLFKMEAAVLLGGEIGNTGFQPVRPAGVSPAVADTRQDTAGGTPVGRTDKMSVFRRAAPSFVFWFGVASVVAALALAIFAKGNSGAFFGAGALLLIAGCLFSLACLRRVADGTGAESIAQLGARNISRRRGRSLATIAVLASGVFMVIAVDSFRKGAPEDSTRRDSGTGGFAFIGESSAPIYEDLNSAKGRDAYALDDKLMSGVRVVQMRVRDGDDASCLNLNRAVQPRIVGVSVGVRRNELEGRFMQGEKNNWGVMDWGFAKMCEDPRTVPAIVDANTLQWALQKKLGDKLDLLDERGGVLKLRVVATVPASILQGMAFVDEPAFVEKFPNVAGYRFFLVDCPREKMDAVREHLTRQLGDRGLELTPAVKRLAEFNEVENTYLSIFQVLGGLGMLLGSAGLGIVVARNVFERRSEFGLLEAVGFTPQTLRRLVFAEHRWLIIGALGIGAVSALTAVWPRLSAQAAHFPWRGILTLLAGMALLGAFWAWLATRLALRGAQLGALRNE